MNQIVTIPKPKDGVINVGANAPLVVFCGPCVIESRDSIMNHAEAIAGITSRLGIPLIFKSSYDKANRTSLKSFRGVGLQEGLEILSEVRAELNIPIVTDVHRESDVAAVAEVADVLQIPAFLCRQTDLLLAVAAAYKPILLKKGQMVAPEDMGHAATKIRDAGNPQVMLAERGSCFGHRDLVVDYRGLLLMADLGYPVIFDATHSVQIMGGLDGKSGGNRRFVAPLARAAVAVGVQGVFLEAHQNPDQAPSDGPNMIPLSDLERLLQDLKQLSEISLATRHVP
jgi:2-dehydro-3-deoxyphosphooctonate aldolase (KDO 8-P synthase)